MRVGVDTAALPQKEACLGLADTENLCRNRTSFAARSAPVMQSCASSRPFSRTTRQTNASFQIEVESGSSPALLTSATDLLRNERTNSEARHCPVAGEFQ
jgi:hypothetical protein